MFLLGIQLPVPWSQRPTFAMDVDVSFDGSPGSRVRISTPNRTASDRGTGQGGTDFHMEIG